MPTDDQKNAGGLKNTLEAMLFVAGKPLRAKDLAKILEQNETEVKSALAALVEEKKDSGIVLLDNKGEYQLATNSKYSTQVKNSLNAELREKLTDATVEALAIIAYRQPISKAEIEAIRGVNSQYSLRNLLMRGLIEKVSNPSDARSFLYQTTTEFLMHLGLISVSGLPEFEKLIGQIKLPETPGLTAQPEVVPAEPAADPASEFQDQQVQLKLAETPQAPAEEPAGAEEEIGLDEDEDDDEK